MKIFKPCHKLKFCPYGPLVEDFPLHEEEEKKAMELGWYSKFVDGKWVECDKDDPKGIPDLNRVFEEFGSLTEESCEIFGHDCPVFTCAEGFSER